MLIQLKTLKNDFEIKKHIKQHNNPKSIVVGVMSDLSIEEMGKDI